MKLTTTQVNLIARAAFTDLNGVTVVAVTKKNLKTSGVKCPATLRRPPVVGTTKQTNEKIHRNRNTTRSFSYRRIRGRRIHRRPLLPLQRER